MILSPFPHQSAVIGYKGVKRASGGRVSRLMVCGAMGGVGSGKSHGACAKIFLHALQARTEVLVTMRSDKKISQSAVPEMMKTWRDVIVDWKEGKGQIELINGSLVHLIRGWDDSEGTHHLDGLNISGAWFSQAEGLPVETWRTVKERCRRMDVLDKEGLPTICLVIDGNPRGKDWIYDLFVRGGKKFSRDAEVGGGKYTWDEYVKDDSFLVSVPTQEFPWLPAGYLEEVSNHHSPRHVARMVRGEWDSWSGAVYDCFDERECVIEEPWTVAKELDRERYARVLGVDWGLKNPCCGGWFIYDRKEDCFLQYREYYQAGKSAKDAAEEMLRMSHGERIDCVLMDPSTKNRDPVSGQDSVMTEFQEVFGDVPVYPSNNDVDNGIEAVYGYVSDRRIHWFPNCVNTLREMEKYRRRDEEDGGVQGNMEKVVKRDDHAPDMIRYVIMGKGYYCLPDSACTGGRTEE